MTLLCALFVIALDRLTKYIAYHSLASGQSINIFPNIFNITLVLNKGIAFGLFKDHGRIFTAVSLFVILFIAFYMLRHRRIKSVLSVALGLILGGAIGNLIDRISLGYVIDFLDFRIWPVFNVADSTITIGTFILGFSLLTQKVK